MSSLIDQHFTALQEKFPVDMLEGFGICTPDEKARQNVDRVKRIAQMAGGFAHYFVVGNEYHDEQHEAYCETLGIDSELYPRAYSLGTRAGHTTIIRRTLHLFADESIYGVQYDVEHVPFDRD